MTDKAPRRISTAKLVAMAVALGILAGAGAVYVNAAWSGNPLQKMAATAPAAPTTADTASCEGAEKTADALAPYTVGEVAAMNTEDQPRRLSALAFQDADGKAMSLADFAGKTLLVNIWATWCVPCRAEMPALDKLEAKLGGKAFQVVAVNIDTGDPDKPAKFLKEIGVSHVKLHRDPTMGVFNELKKEGLAFGLPVSLLVGRNGCLLAAMNGPAEWDGADAAKLIKAAVSAQAAEAGPASGRSQG